MKQKELVYREVLFQTIEQKKYRFTQLALARELNISLSVVNYALKPLHQMGAIIIKLRGFEVIDPMKILLYWASLRNLQKEIIYQTRVEQPVLKIEKELPSGIIFGAYSAYKFRFKNVPADYSEVYVYGSAEEIQKRFLVSENKLSPNLFVLEKDALIENYGRTTTLAQTFVDLWNTKEWYARDFLDELKKKIEEMLQNENSQSPQGAGYKKIRNYLFSVQKATAFLYPLTAQGVFKVCSTPSQNRWLGKSITASGGVSQTNENQ